MRQFVVASLVFAGALPLGAQDRTLDARFSRTVYAEPTFYVTREAYVAVFEIVGDGVVQRYPRVEAQAATPLPAGETTLAWLDINLGQIAQAPGTRTVFYRDGVAAPVIGMPREPVARTMLLVASTRRLKVGTSADFLARYNAVIERQPADRSVQDRALAAVAEVVHPEDASAEMVTHVETMWVVSYPEFRSAAVSRVANESYGYGSPCDAIAPWGYAAYATWTDTSGCPDAYVPYFPGQYFYVLPRFAVRRGTFAAGRDRFPIGTLPGTPLAPGGSPGVHRARPLTTKTMPAVDIPAQTHGGVVFSGPPQGLRPAGGPDGATRREDIPVVARPSGAEPVSSQPATAGPLRGERPHSEPSRAQPQTYGGDRSHREPQRSEPVTRAAEPTHAVARPAPVAPAKAPVATPAQHTETPAPRPAAAASGAKQQTKRN